MTDLQVVNFSFTMPLLVAFEAIFSEIQMDPLSSHHFDKLFDANCLVLKYVS